MKHILNLLDEIRAIAQLGLLYSTNTYDTKRYERLLNLCAEEYSAIVDQSPEFVKQLFLQELGYITPKVGVNGIVFHEDGRLLLEKRADDHCWGIPGGWAEVGESPEESVIREIYEETGLIAEVKEIINVYTRLPGKYNNPHTTCHILYKCNIFGGELQKSEESLEVGFFQISDISEWHRDHKQWALEAYNKFIASQNAQTTDD